MSKHSHFYYKLNKPFGVLSQLSSNDAKELLTKRFLTEFHEFPEGIMPVGRLDEKSEGLLLLTTDGKLSDDINRSGIEKEYLAQLDGEITDAAIKDLINGVEIGIHGEKYSTQKCVVKKLTSLPDLPLADRKIRIGTHRPNSWIKIILTEGKFRQIRKMTAAVGFPTLRLVRIRIGAINLNDMAPGEVEIIDSIDL